MRRAGLEVASFDLRRYADPLVPNIAIGDIRQLKTLAGHDWVVSNLPYRHLTELATHLTDLGLGDTNNIVVGNVTIEVIPSGHHYDADGQLVGPGGLTIEHDSAAVDPHL
jgi:hypothetical protein